MRKFLTDSTEPDPGLIRDLFRARFDLVLPKGVMEVYEQGEIYEIQRVVEQYVAAIISAFSSSYSFARLRNSFIKKGINDLSTDRYQAFQFTCFPFDKGSFKSYPFEIVIWKPITDDIKVYQENKLQEVRRILGVETTFFQYIE